MKITKPLSGFNEPKVSELGGKGYSLAVLINKGFDVPRSFAIMPCAFSEVLKGGGLHEEIDMLARSITKENFEKISEELRKKILNAKIPLSFEAEIKGSLDKLDAKYVSVRSSALSEDSLKASFAGVYDSFLNIKSDSKTVLENVRKCWASLFNQRAIAYKMRKKIAFLEPMSTIVQEMIPAEVSGTALTAHPDKRNAHSSMVIECSWGLGESVVGGLVTPDHYLIDKNSAQVIEKILGKKKIMIKPDICGTKEVETPEEIRDIFCLSGVLIRRLSGICLEIENTFEYPQDIEWCLHKNKLWILQTRAITTLDD